MKNRSLLLGLLLFSLCSAAQNFSGLENKTLLRQNDLESLITSGLSSLFGGKVTGNIDSVRVIADSEKKLRVRIWYTGYTGNWIAVSAIGANKQKQNEVVIGKFNQSAAASPAEVELNLANDVPKGTLLESPYLRIDISKKENGVGSVAAFNLNKKWKNELDPQNVIIAVTLQPVGKAALLSKTEIRDVVPDRKILFNPAILYQQPTKTVNPAIRTIRPSGLRPGGNAFHEPVHLENWSDDITGTWVNTDANTNSITKLVVANGKIQGFGKCSPSDCDWGTVAVRDLGNNNFDALFIWSFKTTQLTMSLQSGQLNVTATDKYTSGGTTRSYTCSFRKNLQLNIAATRIYNINDIALMKPVVSGQPVDKTAKGPDKNVQIYLFDGLSADVDFARPQDISNINMNIFADKNINSGIYYILPADYHLKWSAGTEPEKGYTFKILYGAMKGTGSGDETASPDAPVRMSATLTAGISSRERNFVKQLLKTVRPDFTDLRFLPLRENPQFTFQNTLTSQYNIPQDKIVVSSNSDLNSDIQVAWQTDADTKEFIQTALTSREGIGASVILKPDDESILDQQIPGIINLADIRTLGKINLEPVSWRSHTLRNTTPYPLRLRYIHVMKKDISSAKPIIYSWTMNDAIVPSQGQASMDASIIPAWLDNDPSVVMWVEYSVEPCTPCDQKVMDAVTGGVSGSKSTIVRFTIPPPVFDSLQASYFLITVRSKQADPKGEELRELDPVKVTKDDTKTYSAGPLYLQGGGSLGFEYKITLATADGDFYPSNQWIPATDKDILLGKTKLRDIFRGIAPGIN